MHYILLYQQEIPFVQLIALILYHRGVLTFQNIKDLIVIMIMKGHGSGGYAFFLIHLVVTVYHILPFLTGRKSPYLSAPGCPLIVIRFYFVHLIRLFSGMYSNFCMFWSNTCPFQAFIIGSILVLQIRINNF